MKLKYLLLQLSLIVSLLLNGCAGTPSRDYRPPESGPTASVNLFAPTIQSSAANTEIDFEIFQVQSDCSLTSRGWIRLTPKAFNKAITAVAGEPLFIRLDYFQTDIVLARSSRGEVKFAFKPTPGQDYTIEYKGTGTRFNMDIWQGSPSDGVQGEKVVPLEWNERNGKVVYREDLNCTP